MTLAVLFIVAFAGIAFAFPSNNSIVDSCCTISSFSEVESVTSKCTNIQINCLTVPAGKTLELNLKSGSHVTIAGTITFAYKEWVGPLVEIKGNKVTIEGSNGVKLDGLGAKYWDGEGDKGRAKPKFVKIKTTGGSTLKNVDLLNCPHQCFSIDAIASDTTLTGCDIDISSGDKLGKNTDGYDISGSGITISSATVHNQDDCVAINEGSNIKISGLTCIGGHGLSLSVGKKGSAAKVSNVQISNCVVQNSRNGIHIKTHIDATGGSICDVTYSNIRMSGITYYGINIQQDYANGKSTGSPKGNVPITGLTMKNITGTLTGSYSEAVYILCGSGGCKNLNWSGVSLTGAKKSSSCNVNPTGYKC